MTKLDTVLSAVHAIHDATLHPDPMTYILMRDADVMERAKKALAWCKTCDPADRAEILRAMRALTLLQEELIFLRLAQKLLPAIGPLLVFSNDELLTPISISATSTA